MFGNFIYFIIVLLIFSTYQPVDNTNFPPIETACLFIGLILFFCALTWLLFHRLEKRIDRESPRILDQRFTTLQRRLSVAAVVIYALNIYALNVTDFLSRVPLFGIIPTFQAVICMVIFTGYLSIVWGTSYSAYQRLYRSPLGRGAYVFSQVSFSVPVLMPWIVLSGLSDLIFALPLDTVRQFLSSTEGQLLYFLVFLAAIAIIGPAMIQKFWRCKSLPQGPARMQIEAICRRANVSYRDIVQWPVFGGHMITAGVMGLIDRFRYILVTRALLQHLSPGELDAVIAHEVGHVKKKHLLFYLFFFIGYMIIAYAAFDIIVYFILYSKPAYLLISNSGYDQAAVAPVLLSAVMIVFFLIYFRYIFGYFMRNFERQADAYAFTMFDTASPLISTFKKIAYISGQPADKPNWHHFSIHQRIGFLERCEADRSLIPRHDRKVLRSIIVFLVALLLLGIVGYQLNFGNTGEKISNHLLEEILQREIGKDPQNAQLFAVLGDLYYSRNEYQKTIDAYEQALAVTFDFPHVLNNLAWLYATCEDSRYRLPERALLLAQNAAALEPSPETFDTLGESYYVGGDYEKAIEAETKALELAKNNRGYYEGQIKKFMTANNQ